MNIRAPLPGDIRAVTNFFAALVAMRDDRFFHPHPFTPAEAAHLVAGRGPGGQETRDVYRFGFIGDTAVAYGLLRGWDEGFETPSLGVVVHASCRGRGLGRAMMHHLHEIARNRGAHSVRLKVYKANAPAFDLYASLGYEFVGQGETEWLGRLSLTGRHAAGGRSPHATVPA